jgi:hypothetical protein
MNPVLSGVILVRVLPILQVMSNLVIVQENVRLVKVELLKHLKQGEKAVLNQIEDGVFEFEDQEQQEFFEEIVYAQATIKEMLEDMLKAYAVARAEVMKDAESAWAELYAAAGISKETHRLAYNHETHQIIVKEKDADA